MLLHFDASTPLGLADSAAHAVPLLSSLLTTGALWLARRYDRRKP